ncbi:MAG: TIGR03545 family protein, partial [Pseudobdellovibrio sp.]
YKALGTELNIGEFKSSFIKGNVHISKIELTNRETPNFNSIELADVKFDLNWDALLRVKFVIEEIAVEGIQFMSKRASPGKVAPPEPESNEPGFAQQLQDKALNKLDKDNQNNILGDAAQFLKTGKFDDQIKNIEGQLASKKLLEEMNSKWTAKRTEWDAKIKALPTGPELTALNERFNKIKFKDFANLQELDASVKEADSIVKEIDSKTKQVQELKSQLDADLKSIDQDYKAIDQQIKTDIATIKSRFKIPKIDAASFAKSLFMSYLTPYMQKLDNYKVLATKYLPPKYAKMVNGEKKESEADDRIQPHPRSEGVSYEFPKTNGYPMFWIQKISLSSKSNTQADYGDFQGLISNVTSNQRQIGKPTTVKIDGSFNKMKLQGIHLDAMLNNINKEAVVKYEFGINSYPISNLVLSETKEASISIPATDSNLITSGEVIGFKTYDLKLNNTFSNVNFKIGSENSTIDEILKSTLGKINKFDLQASAKGELKNLDIDIRSSLGGDLERAFQSLLQNKINEANEKLQAAINSEIAKLKTQFNSQVESLKTQAQGEVKKLQTQIDGQKKEAETKVAAAKKDFEDKAKAGVQKELQKQADELKKKLGL